MKKTMDKKWEYYLNYHCGQAWKHMVEEYGNEEALKRIKKWLNETWLAVDNKKVL